ncbi:acetyl-CoA hydrolase/transferase C-terminal domain-containing protein [Allosediminivita pacifica]|uniref:Acyl-CoA hydrolase n=1 Tax=Allosediminivita pacifica TaxID=1267769 RepID=A0A2T6B9H7_9RHOB|nr:acetyl-CoA hydrolase/transferase C-terminal domain-containing protein [Allosediminivita pacifica]PTX52714.1 acyl-CoA hydrolase [Allosediminivita pacifica]GGA96421.1 acetyl-CoA hydrolase [Allosediminivita pacifica]
MPEAPTRFTDAEAMAREIVARLGKDLRIGLPLGLGKPVTLLNALTRLAVENPELRLTIFTALTLERPAPSGDMQKRFLDPALDRLFGAYPQIDYAAMLRAGTLPANIEVREFFFLAGRWLGVAPAQQDYISVNYSHARDVLLAHEPNLILQLVAEDEDRLSMSCNPDITADLMAMRRDGRLTALFAGELNPELPFMEGEAAFPGHEADMLLDPPEPFELFSAVKRPVDDAAHAIGLHVSRLVPDGGTLQIGIGAIGDAVAQALLLRDRGEVAEIHAASPFPGGGFAEDAPFETGLYGVTEMLVDGLLQLFESGVIRRDAEGAAIHAGFFVESRDFYARLRKMPPEKRAKIAMAPVSYTNTLLGGEADRRAARQGARFINSAMKVTLLGAVNSDTRAEGQVVSGVGGQHDFVTQAHALEDGRSIITLPATRRGSGGLESNIVWDNLPETVPRHLRDVVVTEYGIADLRGRSDAEVVAALLNVADSRFQGKLLEKAKAAWKIPSGHEIPEAHRTNLPGTLGRWLRPFRSTWLPDFPFGTDFDATERRLLPALELLARSQGSRRQLLTLAARGLRQRSAYGDELDRMGLAHPTSLRDHLTAAALAGALAQTTHSGDAN